MLVDLSLERLSSRNADDLPPWAGYDDKGLWISGDDSLARETYLFLADDRVVLATALPEMIDALRISGDVRASAAGVSHMLGTGFTPVPSTIYRGVFRLGAGDMARVAVGPAGTAIDFEADYPWLPSKSREDEPPSTKRLFELIVSSVQSQLDTCGRDGLLMLSSGKDSVAIAIAIAELDYDIPCVTYRSSSDNTEHEHAAAFCRRLGLRHQVVEMSKDQAAVQRHLTSFFENAVAPSADHAIIPLITTIAATGVKSGGLIAGDGNDGYMGYIPSARRRKKRLARVRGRRLQEFVARSTRIDSRINYLARARSGAAWPGRNMRLHEIAPIFPDAVDPADRWRQEDARLAGFSDIDRALSNMIRQIEGARVADKIRLAAQARGMRPLLPYCEPNLAQYNFNLPVEYRYSEETHTDKVLLRQLLSEKVDYDAGAVGDGFFAFDGGPFFTSNAEFVRNEILSCSLWEPPIAALVDEWLAAIPNRPFLFHPLLSLLMVSGWHNHSPYLVASGGGDSTP